MNWCHNHRWRIREKRKLLGIPCVPSSSGLNQANAIFHLAKEWNSVDTVVGMIFDTTSSNTGKHAGSSVISGRHFKRKQLWLVCRQHAFLQVVRNVGKKLFRPSNLWTIFWAIKSFLHCNPEEVCGAQTEHYDCWWSYRKSSFPQASRSSPSQMDGKPNLLQQIWRFRGQLDLSVEEREKLGRLNQFVCLFYVIPWLKAALAAEAMAIDLHLMQDIQRYQRTDNLLARAVLAVLDRHLQLQLPSCCSSFRSERWHTSNGISFWNGNNHSRHDNRSILAALLPAKGRL